MNKWLKEQLSEQLKMVTCMALNNNPSFLGIKLATIILPYGSPLI